MRDKLKILTSVWFILSVVILIGNDFLFKEWYGNWLTGKLSDVAGLLAFGLFILAFFPRNKGISLGILGVLFIYWKSPYSEQLITIWNTATAFNLSRVVDPTDLIALFMLPVAYLIYERKDQIQYLSIPPMFPLLIAVFAFCATSYQNELDFHQRYEFSFSKEELLLRLNRIRKETQQPIVSLHIENANDFVVHTLDGGIQDTTGYFFSREERVVNTFQNNNGETDSIVTNDVFIRDSVYPNQVGQFPHYITCHQVDKNYLFRVDIEIRLEGDRTTSALTLANAILYNLELDEELNKEAYLIQEFERTVIDKIRMSND